MLKMNGQRFLWVPPGMEPAVPPAGFQVLPRHLVVGRTSAWFGRYRRFSKDYEERCESVDLLIYLAKTRLMLARLAAR